VDAHRRGGARTRVWRPVRQRRIVWVHAETEAALKTTAHARSRASVTRPAAEPSARARSRAVTVAVDASPRVVAQRQRLEAAFGAPVQRQAEEDEELQMKADDPFQRRAEEDEELLQGRFAGQDAATGARAPGAADSGSVPDPLRSGIESMSGLDLSDVRVHADSSRPSSIDALAFAQGSDIHLGPGQERHLPHEAWHIVQQRQGRVRATVQLRDHVAINDDPGLEREADVMGERALREGTLP
jgi:Domain of unknown function (DUF4157)